MSVTVHIPAGMAKYTGGNRELSAAGPSVGEALDEIVRTHTGLKNALYDDGGRLRRFVAIFADGVDIRAREGVDTPVGEGAEIDIVSAIAGG